MHGIITLSLLDFAFLPQLENAFKDPANTDRYRAISGSSLLLKLFFQCVLVVWGHLLANDSLQLVYKEATVTTHCSWMFMEVEPLHEAWDQPHHDTAILKQGI